MAEEGDIEAVSWGRRGIGLGKELGGVGEELHEAVVDEAELHAFGDGLHFGFGVAGDGGDGVFDADPAVDDMGIAELGTF